jgi:hypothetical protein
MKHKPGGRNDIFTIEQATAMLPLVGAITADIAQLARDLADRRRRLEYLLAGHNPDDRDVYHEELVQVRAELEKDNQRLIEFVNELHALGVELADGPEGLIDFPALIDGRRVLLCWRMGEPEVQYWHEAETGCAGRRRFVACSAAGAGFEGEMSA